MKLAGSWADNELSPECLDGAAGLLKPGGISIPSQYTSYVAPISSAGLWAAAKYAVTTAQKEKNLETLWVVYMQNKHTIAEAKVSISSSSSSSPRHDIPLLDIKPPHEYV